MVDAFINIVSILLYYLVQRMCGIIEMMIQLIAYNSGN